ncbi:MAG TPA: VOC family protein [Gemmatimonadota bacterium]|nr:VOC family protein [Gemmatimonadota bacterium]
MKVNPYLNFDGQCAEAFRFYEKVLGGKIEAMITHGDSPIAGEVPSELHDLVMHARLVVDGQAIMGSDSPPDRFQKPQGLFVSLDVEKSADAKRIFNALADGGSVIMPFEKTFWAAGGFGMAVDRFGTPWMVNCEKAS